MIRLDLALGDREEARQARFRGEQVVVARVERPVGRPGSRSRRASASESNRKLKSISANSRSAWSAIATQAPLERGRPAGPIVVRAGRAIGQLDVIGDRPAIRRQPRRCRARWLATVAPRRPWPRSRNSAVRIALAVLGGERRRDVRRASRCARPARRGAPPRRRSESGSLLEPRPRAPSRASSRSRRVSVCDRQLSPMAADGPPGQLDRVVDPGDRRLRPAPAGRACRGRRWPGPAGGRPGCRCRPTRRRARRGPAASGCRTSCRGGRGTRASRPIEASVASRRSTISRVPIQPRSRAVTVASR